MSGKPSSQELRRGPAALAENMAEVWLSSGVVKQYVHCRPSPDTFVVKRFENSRSIFPLIRPARPIAALVKTKFGPRFAWG